MTMESNTIITLLDENNREVDFDLVMTFNYEGKKYAALLPIDKVENVGDDEVVLLEVTGKSGEEDFKSIDNPILLEEVFNEFMDLFDEEMEKDD